MMETGSQTSLAARQPDTPVQRRLVRPTIRRLEGKLLPVPLWHAAPLPHDESQPHSHALTSLIVFRDDGTVAKTYAPGLIPRAVYWLSFQAQFPYIRNHAALDAAVHRRNLAGMLTNYWYGSRRVARALGIEEINGRLAIVGELVEGTAPRDRERARHFLHDVASRFDDAGLPSWQIDPRQPRSLGNIIERSDGRYIIIDLESGLVSPLASPRAWARAIRRGSVPLFDEVYFDITRKYVEREAARMESTMGLEWLASLRHTIEDAETAEQLWHCSEPRVWRRLLRWFWRTIGRDVPRCPIELPPAGRDHPGTSAGAP